MAERSDHGREIVIIGGGIIGCCTAYYLTRHPKYERERDRIIILEATKIAGGASGKAGGFIAPWADPPCLANLAWRLHSELTKEFDGVNRYGYREVRRLHCTVRFQEASKDSIPQESVPLPAWMCEDRTATAVLKGHGAQLHPLLFTSLMAEEAEARGARIVLGSASSINYSEDGATVKSVSYTAQGSGDITYLPASHVILAAGPWAPTILPKLPIEGARNCAIHLRVPSQDLSPDLVFFNDEIPNFFPRVKFYPRPDNTIHISAGTDNRTTLPSSTTLVQADKEICEQLRLAADFISPRLRGREVLVEQACYRPALTIPGRDRIHGPLLAVTPISGLVLAVGHDNWGIQNGPATGKLVSELVCDGEAASADISSLTMGVDVRDLV
ncbi:FAD dependent oxidoreductase like protein [Zymoseptoria brevis]|uniref:FAD dependent oxidoreductase like protein n=1 Tax=Zymoseptoria brevis TaxID=1047168 RepID=A0A0F4GJZ4_9PEZI|nr:FAD dependent oxidoreductase like protein [Zymoseptoria brevis]